MTKIIAIDPALSKIGWGVLSCEKGRFKYIDSGVVSTNTFCSIQDRLYIIFNEIDNIIYRTSPEVFAVEEIFINLNAESSMKLAYARGVILMLAAKHNLPLYQFKPNHIKKTVTGLGHADKAQMIKMIKILVPETQKLDFSSSDQADALGIAYTCGLRLQVDIRYKSPN